MFIFDLNKGQIWNTFLQKGEEKTQYSESFLKLKILEMWVLATVYIFDINWAKRRQKSKLWSHISQQWQQNEKQTRLKSDKILISEWVFFSPEFSGKDWSQMSDKHFFTLRLEFQKIQKALISDTLWFCWWIINRLSKFRPTDTHTHTMHRHTNTHFRL